MLADPQVLHMGIGLAIMQDVWWKLMSMVDELPGSQTGKLHHKIFNKFSTCADLKFLEWECSKW